MQQSIETQRYPIASFAEQQAAENALETLVQAGLDRKRFVLVPQTLKPSVEETKAVQSAKAGAIVGALLGGIAGLLLGSTSLSADVLGTVEPVRHLIGLTLAGSGIGTASASLIAGISGANVVKEGNRAEYIQPTQGFVIFWTGQPEEVARLQGILQASSQTPRG